jgi:hypothetical protein
LVAIVQEMKRIADWTDLEKQQNLIKLQQITQHNRTHFFSNEFIGLINNELRCNLQVAFDALENKNTSSNYFDLRKQIMSIPALRKKMLTNTDGRTRQQIANIVKKARHYYKKSTNK